MVTSSAGGGLVADQDLRVAGHRNGNDDALAHTARKLVGILRKAHLGVGNAHVPQVFKGLFPGGLALEMLVQLHGSMIWSPMVFRGFRLVMGSCMIMAISWPRTFSQSFSFFRSERRMGLPSSAP